LQEPDLWTLRLAFKYRDEKFIALASETCHV